MNYDAIIIGGGPGGSAAGTFLARAGLRILLLEKEKFPRFHIGESLLPYGNDILKEMGVWEKIAAAGFMAKLGAEFCTGNSTRLNRFWFGDSLPTEYATTFQVERAKFDHLLLQHAAAMGCDVREETPVQDVTVDRAGATVTFREQSETRTAHAAWLIDASGRDGVLGRKLSLPRTSMGYERKIAVYAHFRGVFRNDGNACGHITIVRHGNGWCWSIPLDAEKTSVGLVMPLEEFKKLNGSAEQAFAWMISSSSEMRHRLQNSEQIGGFHVTSDYSYRFTSTAGPRYLLVGDAGGFIDPIFSSGVLMALRSAQLATKHLLRAHRRSRALFPWERWHYTRSVHRMMDVFGEMIRAFYINSSFEVFMNPVQSTSRTVRAVNAFIAGQPRKDLSHWACIRFFHLLCWVNRHKRIMPPLNLNEINPTKS